MHWGNMVSIQRFEYALGLYQNITKRIKNKKVKRFLNSDLALLGLGQAIKAGNRLLDVKPSKPKTAPKPIGLA